VFMKEVGEILEWCGYKICCQTLASSTHGSCVGSRVGSNVGTSVLL